jgi:hypothetical protein
LKNCPIASLLILAHRPLGHRKHLQLPWDPCFPVSPLQPAVYVATNWQLGVGGDRRPAIRRSARDVFAAPVGHARALQEFFVSGLFALQIGDAISTAWHGFRGQAARAIARMH